VETILLVDSLDGDAALLASALRVEGFQVVLATSVVEARKALTTGPMAVALVDLMLRTEGTTNGLELAREIKLAHPTMRVLLTSAYYLSERQLERADCGVSGFIPKPYDVAEVVAFIRAKVSGPPSSRRLCNVPMVAAAEPVSGVEVSHTTTPAAGERARR
jgi:DNA-binding response OmpR family regulator